MINPGVAPTKGLKFLEALSRVSGRGESLTLLQIQYGLDWIYLRKTHDELRVVFATYDPEMLRLEGRNLQNQFNEISGEYLQVKVAHERAIAQTAIPALKAGCELTTPNAVVPIEIEQQIREIEQALETYPAFDEARGNLRNAQNALKVFTFAGYSYPQVIAALGLSASDAGERSKQESVAQRYILDYKFGAIDEQYKLTAIQAFVSEVAFYRLYKLLPKHDNPQIAKEILLNAQEIKRVGEFYKWLAALGGQTVPQMLEEMNDFEKENAPPERFNFEGSLIMDKWENGNLSKILQTEILSQIKLPADHLPGTGYKVTVTIEEIRL